MRATARRRRPLSARASQRGVTLTEAMIALAVFSIGMLGTLQMNIYASGQNSMARKESTASKLGRDVVESFERLPFDHAYFATRSALPTQVPDGAGTKANPDFIDITREPGTLQAFTPETPAGERPLMGSAPAIFQADGDGTRYQVLWRVAEDNVLEGGATVLQALKIVVIVRYSGPGQPVKQREFWTVKSNPVAMGGANLQEI